MMPELMKYKVGIVTAGASAFAKEGAMVVGADIKDRKSVV